MTTEPTPQEQADAMASGRKEAQQLSTGGALNPVPRVSEIIDIDDASRTRLLINLGRDLERFNKGLDKQLRLMERIATAMENLG